MSVKKYSNPSFFICRKTKRKYSCYRQVTDYGSRELLFYGIIIDPRTNKPDKVCCYPYNKKEGYQEILKTAQVLEPVSAILDLREVIC